MSIESELQRIEAAKANIRTALENQGQSVSSNASIDTYSYKVSGIPNLDNPEVFRVFLIGSKTSNNFQSGYKNLTNLRQIQIQCNAVDSGSSYYTQIAASAFSDDANLSNIELSIPGLESSSKRFKIGSSAFHNSPITSVTSTANWYGIVFVNEEANPLHSGGRLYLDGNELTSITRYFSSATSSSGSAILNYAFTGCASLQSLNFSGSVVSSQWADNTTSGVVGKGAFKNCTNLTTLTFNIGSVGNTTLFADEAFMGCTGLTTISVSGNNYKYFGSRVFKGCTGLTTISMPNLGDVSEGLFQDCTSLTTLDISASYDPTGRIVVYQDGFNGCTNLTTLTNGTNTLTIPIVYARGFKNCTSLTSIPCETTIGSVGSNAFENCTGLTHATLSSAYEIQIAAFTGCSNLQSVDLGTITWINCLDESNTALTEVTLRSSEVCRFFKFPASASQHITVYVPSDLISSYQTHNSWSSLYNHGYVDFQAIPTV